MAECFGTCEIIKYTIGDPTKFRTPDASKTEWSDNASPSSDLVTEAKARAKFVFADRHTGCKHETPRRDDTPSTDGEEKCECIEDATQPEGFPRKSKPRTVRLGNTEIVPSFTFEVTVEFATYKGQCDIHVRPPKEWTKAELDKAKK